MLTIAALRQICIDISKAMPYPKSINSFATVGNNKAWDAPNLGKSFDDRLNNEYWVRSKDSRNDLTKIYPCLVLQNRDEEFTPRIEPNRKGIYNSVLKLRFEISMQTGKQDKGLDTEGKVDERLRALAKYFIIELLDKQYENKRIAESVKSSTYTLTFQGDPLSQADGLRWVEWEMDIEICETFNL